MVLLGQMELDDAGLQRRIENKLAQAQAFRGSYEQKLLLLAISSVVGEGRMWCVRGKAIASLRGLDLSGTDHGRDDDPAHVVEDDDERRHREATLTRVIDSLKPRDRRILKAIYWEGQTQAEVARELGITPQTLNGILQRVLRALGERLEQLRGPLARSNGRAS